MPSITTRLERTADRLGDRGLWWLAVVPLVSGFLNVDAFRKVATGPDVHLGLKFGFPLPVSTGWTFISPPTQGVDAGPATGAGLAVFALATVVRAALLSGYLGALHDGLAGREPDVVGSVRDYLVPFLAFGLLTVAALAPPMLVTVLAAGGNVGALAVVVLGWILVLAVLGYVFYAAPYLVVVEDRGVVASLRESLAMASEGGSYARYAGGYLLVVLAASIPATAVFVNLGLPGAVLGVVLLAPAGLVLDATTLWFVADLRGDGDAYDAWGQHDQAPAGTGDVDGLADDRVDGGPTEEPGRDGVGDGTGDPSEGDARDRDEHERE